mgnify:CR=1 FL=1
MLDAHQQQFPKKLTKKLTEKICPKRFRCHQNNFSLFGFAVAHFFLSVAIEQLVLNFELINRKMGRSYFSKRKFDRINSELEQISIWPHIGQSSTKSVL